MSLNGTINTWVAQSESWQAFKDFALPEDDRANYGFLNRKDDFYISLFSRAIDVIKSETLNSEREQDLLALGKGLVIYSLEGKREEFQGVTYADNMLYAAGAYYLSNFPASALLLARKFLMSNYSESIDQFIAGFLSRRIDEKNEYSQLLFAFLKNGQRKQLKKLVKKLEGDVAYSLKHDYEKYISSLLALALVRKFIADNIWEDLRIVQSSRDFWEPFVSFSLRQAIPVWSFFPSQKKALASGILRNETVSLQMPTSAGKTAISELVIYHAWKKQEQHKTLYLAPFRSLAAELNQGMGRNLKSLGITVKSIYGGHLPSSEEQDAIESVNLLISTPEKMLAVEDALPEILEGFDTIICDEGHLLDDENRGLSYELLLARLKASGKDTRRFLFISAIIPNIDVINGWLGGNEDTVITSDYRPTQLEYAFLNKSGTYYNLDVNPLSAKPIHYTLYKYLVPDSLKFKQGGKIKKTTTMKGLSVACALRAIPSGSVALFTTEKRGYRGVEDLAEEVIKQVNAQLQVNKPIEWANDEQIYKLKEYFIHVFGESYLLARLVEVGVLFHHGDLPQDVREVIENALRSEKVRMVICNTTLAEGVNLPIRTMILHATSRFGGEGNYEDWVSVRDLKNLVGRAGRAGKETKGLIIVPHEKDRSRVERLIRDEGIDEVQGALYRMISSVSRAMGDNLEELTNVILDGQNEQFLQWLDAIDVSLIDLLAEDVETEELEAVVKGIIKDTMSYYQATDEEKQAQEKLFLLRAEKVGTYIENGTFRQIKIAGTSLRKFEVITEMFDFNDEIWTTEFTDPLDEQWVNYILTNGFFLSDSFKSSLDEFNNWNGTEFTSDDVLTVITMWMSGAWYDSIRDALNILHFRAIRLVNGFLAFELQTLISSVIRIKIAQDEKYEPTFTIFNWPLFLQHGIRSRVELYLFEMGLTDRAAVLILSRTVERDIGQDVSMADIEGYLIGAEENVREEMRDVMPRLAYEKFERMIALLKI